MGHYNFPSYQGKVTSQSEILDILNRSENKHTTKHTYKKERSLLSFSCTPIKGERIKS